MTFYNEMFEEREGKLVHIASSTGSDTPSYFIDVESKDDWKIALFKLQNNNDYWGHQSKYPFPW